MSVDARSLFGFDVGVATPQSEAAGDANDSAVSTATVGETEVLGATHGARARDRESPAPTPPVRSVKRRWRGRGYFRPVTHIVRRWLAGALEPPPLAEVSDFHCQLALAMIRRKLCTSEPAHADASCRTSLAMVFGETEERCGLKRDEEDRKFVWKYALKLMRVGLRTGHPAVASIRQAEARFRAHYFTGGGDGPALRVREAKNESVTFERLQQGLEAATFRHDFVACLSAPTVAESAFVRSYTCGVAKKLNKLFLRWEKRLAQDSDQTKAQLLEYLRENPQCKLPWSTQEITHAVDAMLYFVAQMPLVRKARN